MQVILDAGYNILWSDMDSAWLTNFMKLAPSNRNVVLVDDSMGEDEQNSENICTGMTYSNTSCMEQAVFCVSP